MNVDKNIIWENEHFKVEYFKKGNRWYLYTLDNIQIAQCLSKNVWDFNYKSNPEIFCKYAVKKRLKGIREHKVKLYKMINKLSEEEFKINY